MKALRRLCATFVLTLMLALSAFAGEIQTGIAATPPPSQQSTTQGEISTGVTATNPATEFVLNLILGVFSLI